MGREQSEKQETKTLSRFTFYLTVHTRTQAGTLRGAALICMLTRFWARIDGGGFWGLLGWMLGMTTVSCWICLASTERALASHRYLNVSWTPMVKY